MKKNVEIEFKPTSDSTLVTNRIGSTEKAYNDLGFLAETPLEDGLKQVVAWKLQQ